MRTQYWKELDSVRDNLIQMGETSLALFDEAIRAVAEPGPSSPDKARDLEEQTDRHHSLIREQCLNVITLQAPVARDARFVTGVLDSIVDLELIADYAFEMVGLSFSSRRPPSQISSQVSELAAKIRAVLVSAVDGWRSEDAPSPALKPLEASIRADCSTLYERLSQLTTAPGDAGVYVNLMLITRHLERILRHAVCVADQSASAAPRAQEQTL